MKHPARNQFARPLHDGDMKNIHDATLVVLREVGLRIDCPDYYEPLRACGAEIDAHSRIVQFAPEAVEETIDYLRNQITAGKKQYLLNGVTNPRWTPPLGCKFGGACIEYLDLEANVVRRPTENDLIRLLQLGQAIDQVGFVGNPVTYLVDAKGEDVPGPLQRIKTAALVAKYTNKCGSTEVWNDTELCFLLEIGEIVRDGRENYRNQPCFITAKETIAPLSFPEHDGKVLLMLARKGLPCTVIPMPITGSTCPINPASNVVMANAEILGVMTALHAAVPQAIIGGGVISGTTDMRTGLASFSAPETILQDAALAQLYDELYGQDLAIGTGYIDAKYPGPQSLAEKALKMQAAAQQGRFNFPVGLLAGGKRWSPEQAIMELEIAQLMQRLYGGIDCSPRSLATDIIEQVGVAGEFLSHEDTLTNFRQLWSPSLLDRNNPCTLDAEKRTDMLMAAREKLEGIWARDDLYCIADDKAREIDRIVAKAEKVLL